MQSITLNSVSCCLLAKSCPTLYDPRNCSTPSRTCNNIPSFSPDIVSFLSMCVYIYIGVCKYGCIYVCKGVHTYVYAYIYAAAAKSLQSCPTLCDPIDGSPPGSAVPGILQAKTLE